MNDFIDRTFPHDFVRSSSRIGSTSVTEGLVPVARIEKREAVVVRGKAAAQHHESNESAKKVAMKKPVEQPADIQDTKVDNTPVKAQIEAPVETPIEVKAETPAVEEAKPAEVVKKPKKKASAPAKKKSTSATKKTKK